MIPKEFDITTYDYTLPDDRIAENAAHPPESARMLCFDRKRSVLSHEHFSDLPSQLDQNCLVFLNDTRVIPSRVHFQDIPFVFEGKEQRRNGEIFFLEAINEVRFRAMIYPGKQFKVGTELHFPSCRIRVVDITDEGRILEIQESASEIKTIHDFLWKFGKFPLPPYIEYSDEKALDYQTAFARKEGSLAAPTASLHFSENLLSSIHASGAEVHFLTLHVGLGTFIGMKTPDIRDHSMHGEFFSIPLRYFEQIAEAKRSGKRIIAVGTTVIRTLESLPYIWHAYRDNLTVTDNARKFWDECCQDILANPFVERLEIGESEVSGYTKLFLVPGSRFRIISEMVTNFHLPKSTLIVLVSAFVGIEFMKSIYQTALDTNYRFYSFWDGMWLR